MKKKYLTFGILFSLAALVFFIVMCVTYTRSEIDDVNDDIYEAVLTINNVGIYHCTGGDEQLQKDLSFVLENYYQNDLTQGSGLYSSIIRYEDGHIAAESSGLDIDGDRTDSALNSEAKSISDEYTATYDPAKSEYGHFDHEDGITKTTIIRIDNLHEDSYLLTHCAVFDPLKSVIRMNSATYIIGILIFLFVESAIIVSCTQLYKSRKEYEIRSQKLTRGIAHELKTPLAVTKATVENWKYLDDEQRREYTKSIKSEVDHMSEMIDKLLEVSRLSGDEIEIKHEEVDLLEVTNRLRERNSELIREKNIDFNVEAKEDSYPVSADPDMMEILVGNFMSNAIKYCDRKITVKLSYNAKKINFSITNDGAKIDKKDIDKIWDVFYTTDDARSSRINNSGVGLSVAKSILEAHKAEYGCESNDSGTTFFFEMICHGS